MVAALYDAVCDTLQAGENYPGWEKGEYPTRKDAEEGEAAGELFVAESGGKIVGTMMLREEQEPAARFARWGKALLEHAAEYAAAMGKKALRLDVHDINMPAIRLYESCGFRHIDTVDLGYGKYGLKWFRLYEKLL